MAGRRIPRLVIRLLLIGMLIYIGVVALVYWRQRSLLFFPSHATHSGVLTPWLDGARVMGCCREVPHPRRIWLMTHGNAGQAADRSYVLDRMSSQDSLYVLEYPGYGLRDGRPSMASMNDAAAEAYQWLRKHYPDTPVCVLGESIGSGPACFLARQTIPPDKIILVVPFDSLAKAASVHFPFLPVRWLLR